MRPVASRSPGPCRQATGGFTLIELIVVIALATLLVVALQKALIGQRRFYEAQRAATERNETLRFGIAALGSALRESLLSEGDVVILSPSRVRVRVPHGFGVVCGTDTPGDRLGIVALRGRWIAGPGDSLLVRRSTGWRANLLEVVEGASIRVPCVPPAGLMVGMTESVPDAVQGSPARSFRSQVFESGSLGGQQWLYRVDGAQREILLGPLAGADGFRVWFEDASGAEVPDAASAHRVVVRVIARSQDVRGNANALEDTLTMGFGERNR